MKAVIVAGGKGERLRPLTEKVPKPMIKVKGKPILEHIINHFKKYGIDDFVFALCYLPKVVTDYFGNGSKFGVKINYTFEDINSPRGTAGAIKESEKDIKDTFIITYADILRDLNINDIVEYHKNNRGIATINVYKRFGADPKSRIIFNQNNLIKKFEERPNPKRIIKDYVWSNGSFYVFEPDIFGFIPEDRPSDFGREIFPHLLSLSKKMYCHPTAGYFIDIANIEKLNEAKRTYRF